MVQRTTHQLEPGENEIEVGTRTLSQGTYLLRVSGTGRPVSKQFVKQ
ncbi:MAG: T9SS type A sorting domain-containing protein [Cytophagales bacterium]|nr:T9SS type A sorting domain-containing protein [Cytophagales bacterium]